MIVVYLSSFFYMNWIFLLFFVYLLINKYENIFFILLSFFLFIGYEDYYITIFFELPYIYCKIMIDISRKEKTKYELLENFQVSGFWASKINKFTDRYPFSF